MKSFSQRVKLDYVDKLPCFGTRLYWIGFLVIVYINGFYSKSFCRLAEMTVRDIFGVTYE